MGREVSSAAAAASQSSQSATCPLCERPSVVRYEQNRVKYEQNRVVYKIEAQGRVYPVCSTTKSGCSWRALFGRRHWRCFEGSNIEKTVWGAARTQGIVGSGARTRFGGVLRTCVSAPRREKKGTRFCSETTRVYPILSIYQKSFILYKRKKEVGDLSPSQLGLSRSVLHPS